MGLQWRYTNRDDKALVPSHSRRARDVLMDSLAFLQSLSLFQGLSDDALRYLAAGSRQRTFRVGETVFYQGEPGSTCHIVARGRLRVYVMGEDGRELSVRLFGQGEIVGEMALFEDLPRSASVEALEQTRTLELDRDVLLGCLRRSPALALELLRSLSARLRHANEEAEGLASLTVPERLMRRLRQLASWYGAPSPDGVRVTLPMNQQELATLVGASRESVNRALMRLRRQGKVRIEGGWIVLLDGELAYSSPRAS